MENELHEGHTYIKSQILQLLPINSRIEVLTCQEESKNEET
jgi:hypothetical protein